MRTLSLLLALLFLAAQTLAQPIDEGAEEVITEEPEITETQDPTTIMLIERGIDGDSTDPKRGTITCYCRLSCYLWEKSSGTCRLSNRTYKLCC
ncbi:defensin-A2-like [Ornithorhynchus anatinus]|uniref:Mammalian defensins domain-containing protein n=1 Tax=Ornithorhynchus anatinus TaxID=9258 RepID=A0A6I8PB05_ORNAN|nr:defensin-A2-like [Ornithorhynchus anatinus]